MVIEYNGTRYHGWQLQSGLPTIQGEIEKALLKLTGERTRVMAASRTDAGVHACGQVVSFLTGSAYLKQTYIDGLNYYLPRDIAVKEAYRVGDSLNVRRDAVSRQYSYHIFNSQTRSPLREGLSYRVSGHLDVDAMNRACHVLIGRHDLASFSSGSGTNVGSTVRNVHRAEFHRGGKMVIFDMVANAFLPHQVRSTVGALIRVGLGRMSEGQFYSIMDAREPGLGRPTAPACGLYLMQVNYPRSFEEETP
ncbi:MAG: tRNA pseudouridine(38-40) synthase TruA [Dehalococcoidales bacterium]|nr:MAG: tRNA pseudouridine(38-40) synthase TruA [Dehalococcoidales bacterium]